MKYHFKIHKEGRGYWAECIELKGCNTEANNKKQLKKNMREALNVFLDDPPNSDAVFHLPVPSLHGRNIVAVAADPKIAFAFYLRIVRLSHGLTQKEASKKLGFKNIFSYQRLEASRTANPQLATIIELKKIFPDFKLEYILSNS